MPMPVAETYAIRPHGVVEAPLCAPGTSGPGPTYSKGAGYGGLPAHAWKPGECHNTRYGKSRTHP